MRKYRIKRLHGVVFLLAALGSSAWATSDTLKLANTGANYPMGGVYTSPYGISVNNGSPVMMICDDFTTDISVGQSWTAIPTTFAALQAGTYDPTLNPKFTPTSLSSYATVAVLAADLMSLPAWNTEQAGEISFALWDVFDPTLLNSTANPYGSITTGELNAALGYLHTAQAEVAAATVGGVINLSAVVDPLFAGQSISGLTIYTPDPRNASQEFLQVQLSSTGGGGSVGMPEPSYPVILAVDLFAVVGVIALLRRRLARAVN